VTSSPSIDKSGLRKCCSAAIIEIQLASTRPPSQSRTCTSARTDQHFAPATMQRDSVSIALDRRMAFSRIRDNMTSCSVWLWTQRQGCEMTGAGNLTYRPTSKAGEAIGLNSVVMVKMPSNLRSSKGFVTSAEIRVLTLSCCERSTAPSLRMMYILCLPKL
jgi:hypothetical protein